MIQINQMTDADCISRITDHVPWIILIMIGRGWTKTNHIPYTFFTRFTALISNTGSTNWDRIRVRDKIASKFTRYRKKEIKVAFFYKLYVYICLTLFFPTFKEQEQREMSSWKPVDIKNCLLLSGSYWSGWIVMVAYIQCSLVNIRDIILNLYYIWCAAP